MRYWQKLNVWEFSMDNLFLFRFKRFSTSEHSNMLIELDKIEAIKKSFIFASNSNTVLIRGAETLLIGPDSIGGDFCTESWKCECRHFWLRLLGSVIIFITITSVVMIQQHWWCWLASPLNGSGMDRIRKKTRILSFWQFWNQIWNFEHIQYSPIGSVTLVPNCYASSSSRFLSVYYWHFRMGHLSMSFFFSSSFGIFQRFGSTLIDYYYYYYCCYCRKNAKRLDEICLARKFCKKKKSLQSMFSMFLQFSL